MSPAGLVAVDAGSGAAVDPPLPEARGPLTAHLIDALRRPPHGLLRPPDVSPEQDFDDEDLQLALYICFELHYRSFAGVDDGWEWEPSLLGWRRQLEAGFEVGLHSLVAPPPPPPPEGVEQALHDLLGAAAGPSLSGYMEAHGSLDQMRELAVHRSAYQLKEADPHTWAIPRLCGDPKAALVHIQSDEYGNGLEPAMHSSLFAATMRALDLDDRYGAYLDRLPARTLATVNLVTHFGLHRRWRGALVGHLAAFEMTSIVPMGRYSRALARMGIASPARRFYDAHVEADAEHEIVAARRLAGGLARDRPELSADILFGAAALLAVEARFARAVLAAWDAGASSLLRPLAVAVGS